MPPNGDAQPFTPIVDQHHHAGRSQGNQNGTQAWQLQQRTRHEHAVRDRQCRGTQRGGVDGAHHPVRRDPQQVADHVQQQSATHQRQHRHRTSLQQQTVAADQQQRLHRVDHPHHCEHRPRRGLVRAAQCDDRVGSQTGAQDRDGYGCVGQNQQHACLEIAHRLRTGRVVQAVGCGRERLQQRGAKQHAYLHAQRRTDRVDTHRCIVPQQFFQHQPVH